MYVCSSSASVFPQICANHIGCSDSSLFANTEHVRIAHVQCSARACTYAHECIHVSIFGFGNVCPLSVFVNCALLVMSNDACGLCLLRIHVRAYMCMYLVIPSSFLLFVCNTHVPNNVMSFLKAIPFFLGEKTYL